MQFTPMNKSPPKNRNKNYVSVHRCKLAQISMHTPRMLLYIRELIPVNMSFYLKCEFCKKKRFVHITLSSDVAPNAHTATENVRSRPRMETNRARSQGRDVAGNKQGSSAAWIFGLARAGSPGLTGSRSLARGWARALAGHQTPVTWCEIWVLAAAATCG
jgi:hypothetical protein